MDILTKKRHFSLSDWDFPAVNHFLLDTAHYNSAPTSLRSYWPIVDGSVEYLFLKEALSGVLPQGRMATWYFWGAGAASNNLWYFRAQALPILIGNIYKPENCYWLSTTYQYYWIGRRVAGVDTELDYAVALPNPWTNNSEVELRVTWWILDGITLRIELERKVAGVWVSQGFIDDPLNMWAGSAVNRVGWTLYGNHYTNVNWMDDTEVWRPA